MYEVRKTDKNRLWLSELGKRICQTDSFFNGIVRWQKNKTYHNINIYYKKLNGGQ